MNKNILKFFISEAYKAGKEELTELEMQKSIYILQSTGVIPSKYIYNACFRGPISYGLKEDIMMIVDEDLLEEKYIDPISFEKHYKINGKEVKKIRDTERVLKERCFEEIKKDEFNKLLNEVIINSTEEELCHLAKLIEIAKMPPNVYELFIKGPC